MFIWQIDEVRRGSEPLPRQKPPLSENIRSASQMLQFTLNTFYWTGLVLFWLLLPSLASVTFVQVE